MCGTRSAAPARCSGFLLLLDWGIGRSDGRRGPCGLGLALLLLLALYPARVRAGDGWLASRRLLREHHVRTDLLVSVRCLDGMSQRLAAAGLGRRPGGDRPRSPRAATPVCGRSSTRAPGNRRPPARCLRGDRVEPPLRRVDRETAHAVFRVSDLE